MGRLILAIVAFVLALAVIKAAIVALVIAGLIFRTKETVALLLLGGVITALNTYPAAGLALLAVIAVAAVVLAVRRAPRDGEPEPERLRLRQAIDDPDQE